MGSIDRRPRCRRTDEAAGPQQANPGAVTTPPATVLPDVLTVEEAARYLRIGRASAYELARRFRESGGAEGLPVVVLGRSLRVPRHALEQLLALERPPASQRPRDNGHGPA